MAPSLCYPANLSVPALLLTAVSVCHATIARRVWIHGISPWFNRVIRGVNPRLANRIDCPGTSFFSQSLPSERVWGCCAKDVRSLKFSDCRLHLQSGKVRVMFSRIFTAFRVAKRKCHKWSAPTFRRQILVRRSPRADHEATRVRPSCRVFAHVVIARCNRRLYCIFKWSIRTNIN